MLYASLPAGPAAERTGATTLADVTEQQPARMESLDTIELRGLRGFGRHGVLESERRLGQTFLVDVRASVDTRPSAASDDVADTVDYGVVAESVLQIVEGEPVALLETLAQRICDAVLAHAPVQAVDVTVHKPSAPLPAPFDDIAVTIRRTRA
jgi:dihydroneopterin aldolase